MAQFSVRGDQSRYAGLSSEASQAGKVGIGGLRRIPVAESKAFRVAQEILKKIGENFSSDKNFTPDRIFWMKGQVHWLEDHFDEKTLQGMSSEEKTKLLETAADSMKKLKDLDPSGENKEIQRLISDFSAVCKRIGPLKEEPSTAAQVEEKKEAPSDDSTGPTLSSQETKTEASQKSVEESSQESKGESVPEETVSLSDEKSLTEQAQESLLPSQKEVHEGVFGEKPKETQSVPEQSQEQPQVVKEELFLPKDVTVGLLDTEIRAGSPSSETVPSPAERVVRQTVSAETEKSDLANVIKKSRTAALFSRLNPFRPSSVSLSETSSVETKDRTRSSSRSSVAGSSSETPSRGRKVVDGFLSRLSSLMFRTPSEGLSGKEGVKLKETPVRQPLSDSSRKGTVSSAGEKPSSVDSSASKETERSKKETPISQPLSDSSRKGTVSSAGEKPPSVDSSALKEIALKDEKLYQEKIKQADATILSELTAKNFSNINKLSERGMRELFSLTEMDSLPKETREELKKAWKKESIRRIAVGTYNQTQVELEPLQQGQIDLKKRSEFAAEGLMSFVDKQDTGFKADLSITFEVFSELAVQVEKEPEQKEKFLDFLRKFASVNRSWILSSTVSDGITPQKALEALFSQLTKPLPGESQEDRMKRSQEEVSKLLEKPKSAVSTPQSCQGLITQAISGKRYQAAVVEMAQHLQATSVQEFLDFDVSGSLASKGQAAQQAPGYTEAINKRQQYVTTSILTSKTQAEALKKCSFWIDVANESLKNGDIQTAQILLSACAASSVNRIIASYGDAKLQQKFDDLSTKLSPLGANKKVREAISLAEAEHKPVVPSFSAEVTDATFIYDGNLGASAPNRVAFTGRAVQVNIARQQRLRQIAEEAPFGSPMLEIQTYSRDEAMGKLKSLIRQPDIGKATDIDKMFYARSLELFPRKK